MSSGDGLRCAACAADRPASAYSASQRKQPATKRRCAECLEFNRQPKTAQTLAAAPPAAAQPSAALALPVLDQPAWVPGAPWPHAVTLRGVPPLYPGPALWVRDLPAFYATLPPELRSFPPFLLEAYANQLELDERFALLLGAYELLPGGTKAPRPHAQHAQIFAACGLTLHVRDPGYAMEAMDLLREQGGYSVDASMKLSRPAERFCDKCKRPAAARCRCGEAYCSRECQMADWNGHRKICEYIKEAFQSGLRYNALYWAMRGVGNGTGR